jgi:hypothetical protein
MGVTHVIEHGPQDQFGHGQEIPPGAVGGGYGPVRFGPPGYEVPAGRGHAVARMIDRLAARTPSWGAPAAIALCFAGAASFVLATNPTDTGAADLPTCIVKLTTGLDCPGCGGTRAFYYLLQGNIPEAARHHAIAVFAAPFLVWLYLAWAVKRITGRTLPTPRISSRAISLFLVAWAVFAVVRNLPFAPFTSLYV